MTFDVLVDNSIRSLYIWVKSEEYYGWDPYDALNSELVNKLCFNSQLLEILITQLNKYSILNIRPVLGIEKGLDIKGISLFAQSFSKIYSLTNDQQYKSDLFECINFLKNKSLNESTVLSAGQDIILITGVLMEAYWLQTYLMSSQPQM